MSSLGLPSSHRAFSTLQGLARKRDAAERCELCGAELPSDHQHLLAPVERKLVCACEACAILFSAQVGAKYKRVPRRARLLINFRLTDVQWDALMLPINMAFFFRSTPDGRVIAMYPSPAGPTESLLTLDAWNDIVKENPVLAEMEPDVEAFLVNRLGHARGYSAAEYFLAPIDECYKLVGLIRANWKGLSGGVDVWREIGRFFAELREKAGAGPGGGLA